MCDGVTEGFERRDAFFQLGRALADLGFQISGFMPEFGLGNLQSVVGVLEILCPLADPALQLFVVAQQLCFITFAFVEIGCDNGNGWGAINFQRFERELDR